MEMAQRSDSCSDVPRNKDGFDQKRVSKSEAEALDYLDKHHISELYSFLMGHLVVAQPDDPISYLFDLLDKCTLFRSGLIEPPLLFTPRHIESMYKSFDPCDVGHISLDQYVVGMKTLGIKCYDPDPMDCQCVPNQVDKETFLEEAKRCLVKMLKEMIAKPQESC